MNNNNKTIISWNNVADLYEDKFMNLALYNPSYNRFCELLSQENARILDVGCGPGNITKYMLSNNSNLVIHGVDYASKMINLARKNNKNASFSILSIEQINKLKADFDGIICGFCIPYINRDSLVQFIIDAKDLLSDNGVLYISFVDGNYTDSSYISGPDGNEMFFYYHSLVEIKKELISNNFIEKEIIKVDYTIQENQIETHTILIYQKGLKASCRNK